MKSHFLYLHILYNKWLYVDISFHVLEGNDTIAKLEIDFKNNSSLMTGNVIHM
jgi:hypothetical protein